MSITRVWPGRIHVEELAAIVAVGDVGDDVEFLSGGAEGLLEQVVVVGGDDQLIARRNFLAASSAGMLARNVCSAVGG